MKLVQKILSHGLLIGFFVATFFGYLYRAELFPQWFGDEQRVATAPAQTAPADQVAARELKRGKVESASDEPVAPAAARLSPLVDTGDADLPPMAGTGVDGPADAAADLPPLAGTDVVESTGAAADLPPLAGTDVAESTGAAADLPPVAGTDVAESTGAAADLPPVAGTDMPAPAVSTADLPPVAAPQTEASPPQRIATADRDRDLPPPTGAGFAGSTDSGAMVGSDAAAPPRYRPLDPERQVAPPDLPAHQHQFSGGEAAPVEAVQAETGAAEPGAAVRVASEVAQAEVAQAEVAQAEVAQAEVAQAEVTQAEVTQAEVTQAEVTQAEVAQAQIPAVEIAKVEAAGVQAGSRAGDSEFQQQLAVARGYFWRRDLRAAVQAYRHLTESWPTQADAWGELGNLYLTTGYRVGAADAYYRAIGLLLDQGDLTRAQELLTYLYRLDSRRAGEIEKRLRQVSG